MKYAPSYVSTYSTLFIVTILGVSILGCSNIERTGSQQTKADSTAERSIGSVDTSISIESIQEETGTGSSVLAPDNDKPVPVVVGMKAEKACRLLDRRGYAAGIFREVREIDLNPGRVVRQSPKPGYMGFEAQVVYLTVSTPFPDRLPENSFCSEERVKNSAR